MPPTEVNRTVYNLRNVKDISILNRRMELLSRSVLHIGTVYHCLSEMQTQLTL